MYRISLIQDQQDQQELQQDNIITIPKKITPTNQKELKDEVDDYSELDFETYLNNIIMKPANDAMSNIAGYHKLNYLPGTNITPQVKKIFLNFKTNIDNSMLNRGSDIYLLLSIENLIKFYDEQTIWKILTKRAQEDKYNLWLATIQCPEEILATEEGRKTFLHFLLNVPFLQGGLKWGNYKNNYSQTNQNTNKILLSIQQYFPYLIFDPANKFINFVQNILGNPQISNLDTATRIIILYNNFYSSRPSVFAPFAKELFESNLSNSALIKNTEINYLLQQTKMKKLIDKLDIVQLFQFGELDLYQYTDFVRLLEHLMPLNLSSNELKYILNYAQDIFENTSPNLQREQLSVIHYIKNKEDIIPTINYLKNNFDSIFELIQKETELSKKFAEDDVLKKKIFTTFWSFSSLISEIKENPDEKNISSVEFNELIAKTTANYPEIHLSAFQKFIETTQQEEYLGYNEELDRQDLKRIQKKALSTLNKIQDRNVFVSLVNNIIGASDTLLNFNEKETIIDYLNNLYLDKTDKQSLYDTQIKDCLNYVYMVFHDPDNNSQKILRTLMATHTLEHVPLLNLNELMYSSRIFNGLSDRTTNALIKLINEAVNSNNLQGLGAAITSCIKNSEYIQESILSSNEKHSSERINSLIKAGKISETVTDFVFKLFVSPESLENQLNISKYPGVFTVAHPEYLKAASIMSLQLIELADKIVLKYFGRTPLPDNFSEKIIYYIINTLNTLEDKSLLISNDISIIKSILNTFPLNDFQSLEEHAERERINELIIKILQDFDIPITEQNILLLNVYFHNLNFNFSNLNSLESFSEIREYLTKIPEDKKIEVLVSILMLRRLNWNIIAPDMFVKIIDYYKNKKITNYDYEYYLKLIRDIYKYFGKDTLEWVDKFTNVYSASQITSLANKKENILKYFPNLKRYFMQKINDTNIPLGTSILNNFDEISNLDLDIVIKNQYTQIKLYLASENINSRYQNVDISNGELSNIIQHLEQLNTEDEFINRLIMFIDSNLKQNATTNKFIYFLRLLQKYNNTSERYTKLKYKADIVLLLPLNHVAGLFLEAKIKKSEIPTIDISKFDSITDPTERNKKIEEEAQKYINFAIETLKWGIKIDSEKYNKLWEKFSNAAPLPEWTLNNEKFYFKKSNNKTYDYVAYFLKREDPRGMFLGQYTNCCQHPDGAADFCAFHGQTSPHGAFFVVEDKEGEILAQSWVWESQNKNIIFDNVESKGLTPERQKDILYIYENISQHIKSKYNQSVFVGTSYNKVDFGGPIIYNSAKADLSGEKMEYTDAYEIIKLAKNIQKLIRTASQLDQQKQYKLSDMILNRLLYL